MKLLLVEDEKDLARSIIEFITDENYNIDAVHNFNEAKEKISLLEYECALIDIMLPDGSGFDLVKLLQKNQPNCGIIIITAKDSLDDKINGLSLGADDYITKPFHLAELNARINSVIRRRNFEGKNEIILNEITVDTQKREVKICEIPIELTRREYDILIFLLSNKNRILTKESIVEHVWGDNSNAFDNFDFIYTHVKNLRKKITDAGGKDYIISVYGIGYKFKTE